MFKWRNGFIRPAFPKKKNTKRLIKSLNQLQNKSIPLVPPHFYLIPKDYSAKIYCKFFIAETQTQPPKQSIKNNIC